MTRVTWATLWVVGAGCLFLLGYGLTYAILGSAPQENSKRVKATVEAVCDYSRDRVSGELEEACGIAQDTSNTVYRCPKGKDGANYSAPTSQCWVEDRQ